jgi:hypothetical protein
MRKRPAAPHAKRKAAARVLSPDEAWAAKIRERILADCHPWQRDAVLDPARRYSILTGRGATKTTTFRARGALKATGIRRAEILYLALTEDHARELNWDPLQDMNEHYGLELRFNKSELTATCARTGSRYVMGGMENDQYIEQYRGKSRDELQVDESASQDPARLEKLLDRIVGPRLGDRKGCIGLGGTPGHILSGEFYDATRPGSAKHAPYADRHKPGYMPAYWSSHAWSLKDVCELPNAAELYPALVALWAEALLEKAAKGWSDDNPIWVREYIGLWAADHTGRVFQYRPTANQWDPFDGQRIEGVPGLRLAIAKLHAMGVKDLHFVVPADGGHADPFAINVLAFSPTDARRRIWHVMFLERTGWYARLVAELVAGPESIDRMLKGGSIEPLGGVLGETNWPDASVLDTDGSTIAELKNVYGLAFKKADREANAKKGKIEHINGEFHEERLYIIKNSPAEDQFTQLQWKEDINGRLKEDPRQANHSTDGITYGCDEIKTLFETGVVAQESTATTTAAPTAYADPQGLDGGGIGTDTEFDGLLADVDYVDASWGNG